MTEKLQRNTPKCPACRADITTLRDIRAYKRVYLKDCPEHLELWDTANAEWK